MSRRIGLVFSNLLILKMKLYHLLILIPFSACNTNAPVEESQTTENDSSEVEIEIDTVKEEQEELPPLDPSFDYQANILQETYYHSDEVMDNVNDLEWWGLFKSEEGFCYVDPATMSAERVNDGILDGINEQTGWEIKVDNDDYTVLLINNLDFIVARDVKEFEVAEKMILPGEELKIEYLGRSYRFYAEGELERSTNYGNLIRDYQLFMTISAEGDERTQLMTEVEYFDDSMVQILFIGDIDGDGILDLVLDNSYHYNVTFPTLYLSRPASEDQILKKVGELQSVGC
jgi:hypothetical protein